MRRKPLTLSRPSQLNHYEGHGKRIQHSNIMAPNKIVQKPVHGTTIGPHDGQPWSMMNEKDCLKMPGVDHPMASVDDLGAYEVAQGNLFPKNDQVAIKNKVLANEYPYRRS